MTEPGSAWLGPTGPDWAWLSLALWPRVASRGLRWPPFDDFRCRILHAQRGQRMCGKIQTMEKQIGDSQSSMGDL